ncbi:hypothetical protein NHQ30_000153 [Ciborinia camelliae]|nr:hypothetical protein NHQ30_000153 [Ciborinia camelliae]
MEVDSSINTETLPIVTIGIVTSIILQSGTTFREPIITGGALSSPITLPFITTTTASSQATKTVLDDLTSETDDLTPENNSESKTNTDSSRVTSTSWLSSTSSSSCDSTQSALRVTVLCVPTTFKSGGSTVLTRSPTTTVTTSGCSVTGMTTTISSSTLSSVPRIACAHYTCGALCPVGNGGSLSDVHSNTITASGECSFASTITTSALPTASSGVMGNMVIEDTSGSTTLPSKRGSSIDIIRYNETQISIFNELVERGLPQVGPPYSNYVSTLSKDLTNKKYGYGWFDITTGITTGSWYDYSDNQILVGLRGLYGCTSVIITSWKGVYISHIYEVPVFIDETFQETDNDYFTANAFNALRDGAKDTIQSIKALIGNNADPGVLHPRYNPKVFVIALLGIWDDNEGKFIKTDKLRYEARAQNLARDISGIIPGSDGSGEVVGYKTTDEELSNNDDNAAGRAILEMDPCQAFLTADTTKNPHPQVSAARTDAIPSYPATICPTTTNLLPMSCTGTTTAMASTTSAANPRVTCNDPAIDCPPDYCPNAGDLLSCTDGLCACWTSPQ